MAKENEEIIKSLLLLETANFISSSSSSSTISSSTSSSTSSSSSDDDDIITMLVWSNALKRRKQEDYIDTVFNYNDIDFKLHFRLRRSTIAELARELEESGRVPTHCSGKEKINSEKHLLITMWYLANAEPLRGTSERFEVSESSLFRVLRRVITWLAGKQGEVVRWPGGVEAATIASDFEGRHGVPGILGVVGTTQIKIIRPKENHELYANREGSHSLILQVVVDSWQLLRHIHCGEPGSLHETTVLQRSDLYSAACEDPDSLFPAGSFLVGDAVYPTLPWLLAPYADDGYLTHEQVDFNSRLAAARETSEHTLATLRDRFHRLRFIELRNPEFAGKVVVACCVAYNLHMRDAREEGGDEVGAKGSSQDDVASSGQVRREELFDGVYPGS